jgi:hypothetical protein
VIALTSTQEAMKTEDIGEEADVHAIRHIIFTEKGKYYELEQVNDLFISLRNITDLSSNSNIYFSLSE